MTEVQLLRGSVESLQRQRDEWVAKHKECTQLLGEALQDTTNVSIERDEWKARCEFSFEQRDKLTAERDALKTSNDSYITLANTAYELTEQRTAERDALKDAARLALDVIDNMAHFEHEDDPEKPISEAIAALKAVL